jgi:hypothetical protein
VSGGGGTATSGWVRPAGRLLWAIGAPWCSVGPRCSFFEHHRVVEQRGGSTVFKLAPLKKSIYGLGDLRQLTAASSSCSRSFKLKADG